MRESLLNKVKRYIQDRALVQYREHVLVACSGGQDSVCLMEALCVLAPLFSWKIFVGHVNHGIRGQEAQDDAKWVAELCRLRGLPFFLKEVEAPAFAAENGRSLEEAARILRYRALEEIADENDLSVVAVAHHQEDNAETIIMNILRGSVIDGMSGIKARRLKVVRPFLCVEKAEIEEFCRQNRLEYRLDSSNDDKRHLRNRLRLELMPVLREYNPEIAKALCRMGDELSRDAAFLSGLAKKAYREMAAVGQEGLLLPLDKLKALDQVVLSRVMVIAIKDCLQGGHYINYQHVTAATELAQNGRTGAMLDLPGGLHIKRTYVALCFSRKPFSWGGEALSGEYVLPVPGRVVLPDKRIVRASIFRGERPKSVNKSKAVFPAAVAEGGLVVRGRVPGDVFQPMGMQGCKRKLKDFFIDSKIPAKERERIPLVVDRDGLLWVAGVREAHRPDPEVLDKWLYLELLEKEYINV